MKENNTKTILDKYATIVVEKDAVYTKDGSDGIDRNKERHYSNGGYNKEIVLWIAPKDCLRIEFEDTTKQNEAWITECEAACKAKNIDYCITGHKGGKSPYLNIFNIKGIPVNHDNKLARELLADHLLPSGAKKQLDKTNLGWTLTPVIGHPHWKNKYKGTIHKVLTGKSVLDHANEYPKELLVKLKAMKKRIDKSINKTKWSKNEEWIEDFLLNYCTENLLPAGERHQTIEKNLAALIITRQDRELIENKYFKAQGRKTNTLRTWYNAIMNNQYTEVSAGELHKYIKEKEIDYKIKRTKKEEEPNFFNIDNYISNVEKFWMIQPFFCDKARMFWFWNKEGFRYEIVDEVDVMRLLDNKLNFFGQTVKTSIKTAYIEAFKRVGREKIPLEPPKRWIQFKNKAFSLESKMIYDVTPQYFFTNPIPFELGENDNTPTMDKLFIDWVGEENKDVLYELIAYCCYTDYPIQLLFCLWGNGRNGKTQYIKILNKFLGHANITSTELDVLTEHRFEIFKLYKKLVCEIGETNFGMLSKSSIIKRLTGGDLISFEKKNKDAFDDYNYAKIIINSNSLPSSHDTSDGFYRRWMILSFENEFEETGREVWLDVPEEEYMNLARKVCGVLPKLLNTGKFKGQGSIQERKEKYISVSNPLSLFIEKVCVKGENEFIEYSKLYNVYIQFLQRNKRRKVSHKEFRSGLEDEGFYPHKTSKPIKKIDENGNEYIDYRIVSWVEGLGLSSDFARFAHFAITSTQIPIWKSNMKYRQNEQNEQNLTFEEFQNLLLDRPSFPVENLLSKGFTMKQINKWSSDGLIFENPSGFWSLLT